MMSLCLSVNPPAPTGNEPNRAHGIPAPWQGAKPLDRIPLFEGKMQAKMPSDLQ